MIKFISCIVALSCLIAVIMNNSATVAEQKIAINQLTALHNERESEINALLKIKQQELNIYSELHERQQQLLIEQQRTQRAIKENIKNEPCHSMALPDAAVMQLRQQATHH